MYLSSAERGILLAIGFIIILVIIVAYTLYLDEILILLDTVVDIFNQGRETISRGLRDMYNDLF